MARHGRKPLTPDSPEIAGRHTPAVVAGVQRSPHWPTFEKALIVKRGGCCEACGCKADLVGHHKVPYHLDPAKELSEENVIILCQSAMSCHLGLGHAGDWKAFSPQVEADAATRRERTKHRKYAV